MHKDAEAIDKIPAKGSGKALSKGCNAEHGISAVQSSTFFVTPNRYKQRHLWRHPKYRHDMVCTKIAEEIKEIIFRITSGN
jgi:hypothetical protein